MHRKVLLPILVAFFLFEGALFAQLQNGTTAPDWTLTDINKNVWHLYDLTAKGKTVFIDVSATWCGPCWRYHQKRSLDSLYEEHGPKGTIDQSCYVFFIEGDGRTNYNDLTGKGTHTTGNWVANTDFPIIDPGADTINTWNANYKIMYFPTVYMICPDNRIYVVGPGNKDILFGNTKSGCPPVIQNKNWKGLLNKFDGNTSDEMISVPTSKHAELYFLLRKRFSILGTPNS